MSTPCGATTTSASTVHHVRSASAVTWLGHTTTVARRAARRMARRNRATLERSCHSGASKKLRSCTVTTVGTDGFRGIV